MLPMTTAAHKPQETIDEMLTRIENFGAMSREDAQRILEASANTVLFHQIEPGTIQQAIAVKLAGM